MWMKAIQFTITESLLKRVDSDREARALGRSAFLRKAIEEYLRRKRAGEIRQAYRKGYGAAPPESDEFETFPGALAWPEE
jgi:metal-responsive CopG/Arc/MetJ family transcriptional regulator